MDCARATLLIEKLVDGEASPAEMGETEDHIERCASCREHFTFLTAVANHSRASEPPGPPESYWEHLPRKILQRIDSKRAHSERGFWQRIFAPSALRWGALGATVAVVMAVGVSVLREDSLSVASEAARPESVSSEPVAESVPAASVAEPEPPELRPRTVSPAEQPARPAAKAEIPAPPVARAVEGPTDEAAESFRSRDYVADAAEKHTEVAAPSAPTAPAEGLESAFADVAGNARVEQRQTRENASQLESRNEPAPAGEAAGFSRASTVDECEKWRKLLASESLEDRDVVDVRYELARCSIRSLPADASDERRAGALADAEAFLALEGDGTRAEEIRQALKAAIRR